MTPEIATASCWVILVASCITAVVAVIGLVADSYHDTFLECVALCCVALAGFVVAMQIRTFGYAQGSGLAFLAASVAVFAVANFFKNLHHVQRHDPRRSYPRH